MRNFYWIILLLGVGLTSCKKEKFELPDGTISEDPVFVVRGQIGEQQIEMTAGVDGAYLETSVSVVNEIDFFNGKMIKGAEIFTLSVSDGDIGLAPSIPDIISANVPFAFPPNSWYSVNQNDLPNSQQIQSVNFSVNGINEGNNIEIVSSGFHTVCANVVFSDGTARSVCNKLLLGYKDYGGFLIKSNAQAGSVPTVLWIESSMAEVAGVKWYINNQYHSDSSMQLVLNQGMGVVTVKAEVTFKNGLVREHSVIVDTEGQGRNFFDMEAYKTSVADELLNDFKILLTYKNGTGFYTSYSTPDSPGLFMVESVSLFKEKPNGNKIYKVSGTIQTQLVDLLSGVLLPLQLNVVFAVELPY